LPQTSASLRNARRRSQSGASGLLHRGLGRVAALWRRLAAGMTLGYRPERHYMRGPGPKWHERYPGIAAHSHNRHPGQDPAPGRANNLE
jgi:hypothetical protein